MARDMKIIIDTSILIDFYRKQKKEKSKFYELIEQNHSFAVSVITEYEILVGSDRLQDEYWQSVFSKLDILPLTSGVIQEAVEFYRKMKKTNTIIEIPDIMIGATSVYYDLELATLNRKHFERLEGVKILK